MLESRIRRSNPRPGTSVILDAMERDGFREEVERLAVSSVRRMRPTAAVSDLAERFSWHARSMVARSWMRTIVALNFFVIPLDYLMADVLLSPAILLRGLFIPAVYLLAVQAWTKPRAAWLEAASITLFAACMMALAGTLGAIAGPPVQERYVTACFMVVSTGVAIIPLRARSTVPYGVCNCLAFAACQSADPMMDTFALAAMCLFFGAVTAGLIMARFSSNGTQMRSVLMHFRDVYRVEQIRRVNLKLQELATTDPLTGIYNRRSIMERLEAAFPPSSRTGRICVALIDIDHFKRLNDTLGHQEGDRCLRAVARSLMAGANRAGGHVGRFGGEEFLLVLQDGPAGRAVAVCEDLRRDVERLALRASDDIEGRPITVSIGLACLAAGDGTAADQLLQAADDALYAAKEGGRNAVRLAKAGSDTRSAAFAA